MELKLVENGKLTELAINMIVVLETEAKEIKAKQDEMKKALLEAMRENNIIKLESDDVVISYIAESYRESFDSKKFKADHEDMYNEYVKISNVSDSVRIKVK